ncbi:hypothetical protein OSB04_019983 [Centaurea solstitialis]|uniref:Uncharacterized protein n=1 Tax=Centaurea solstitialis TaxID=347529 RepID=A0AA38SRD2_9ASTR|nr:hypothetical protein OSB04_019983 [Centaurea solstitialis]
MPSHESRLVIRRGPDVAPSHPPRVALSAVLTFTTKKWFGVPSEFICNNGPQFTDDKTYTLRIVLDYFLLFFIELEIFLQFDVFQEVSKFFFGVFVRVLPGQGFYKNLYCETEVIAQSQVFVGTQVLEQEPRTMEKNFQPTLQQQLAAAQQQIQQLANQNMEVNGEIARLRALNPQTTQTNPAISLPLPRPPLFQQNQFRAPQAPPMP